MKNLIFILIIFLSSCSQKRIQFSDLKGGWIIESVKLNNEEKADSFLTLGLTFLNHNKVYIPYLRNIPHNEEMHCNWKFVKKNRVFLEDCRQDLLTGVYDIFLDENKLTLKKEGAVISLVKISGDWMNGGYPTRFGKK